MTRDDGLRLVAVHEAGHAVAACILAGRPSYPISIVPDGDCLGYAHSGAYLAPGSRPRLVRAEAEVRVLLAGLAAEEVIGGRVDAYGEEALRGACHEGHDIAAADKWLLAAGVTDGNARGRRLSDLYREAVLNMGRADVRRAVAVLVERLLAVGTIAGPDADPDQLRGDFKALNKAGRLVSRPITLSLPPEGLQKACMSAPLISVVPPVAPEVPDLLKVRTSRDEAALRAAIPAEMWDLPRWNTWRGSPKVLKGGKAKLDKKPKSGRGLSWGSTKESSTWGTASQALATLWAADKAAQQSEAVRIGTHPESAPEARHGFGFNVTNGIEGVPDWDGFSIDIDWCRDPVTGKANAEAQAIIDAAQTYTEVTPSGRGFRLFGRGGDLTGLHDFCGAGVEFYRGEEARFLTVTGECVANPGKLSSMTPALAQLLAPHVTSEAPHKAAASPLPPLEKLPPAEWEDLITLSSASDEELTLIREGLPAGDRSEMVLGIVCRLLTAGTEPADVYAFLITSPGLWDYALTKRQGNVSRAQALLWAEVKKGVSKTGAGAAEGGASAGTLTEALKELNKQYFVADEQGKIFVCTLQPDPDRKNREVLVRYTFKAFSDKFKRKQFLKQVQKEWHTVELGREFLKWPACHQYERITFDPRGNTPPDVFNLWRGWPVEPAPGDWSLIRTHIEQVICGGSPELIRYVMGWLAFLVQRPWEMPGTALILRGKEGAGKSMFGEAVRNLAGAHSMAVSNAKHLVGNFNQHLRNCLVLLANEAIFAGNHEHASILKALITDSDLIIEGKGINALLSRNHLHVIMTSNEDWVVPAGLEARRFVVLDVNEERRGDFKYFASLGAAICDDRVLGAMLHDLQEWPLEGFEVRTVPDTAGLRDQKVRSLGGLNGWLVDFLTAGELPPDARGNAPPGWHTFFMTKELHSSFAVWVGSHRRGERVLSDNIFGKEMSKIFPWHRRAPAREGSWDSPGYRFGTLAEAREQFCARTGLPASIFDHPPVDPLS